MTRPVPLGSQRSRLSPAWFIGTRYTKKHGVPPLFPLANEMRLSLSLSLISASPKAMYDAISRLDVPHLVFFCLRRYHLLLHGVAVKRNAKCRSSLGISLTPSCLMIPPWPLFLSPRCAPALTNASSTIPIFSAQHGPPLMCFPGAWGHRTILRLVHQQTNLTLSFPPPS